ncbi:helix-turn-helix transcriptional regulator [Streptomyces sp. PSKA54]|uniref:Helix-turn-helix transcriptional regulator n=1 Tax=Streptomyces himalayensis subsp. aureolus TaxID=2758039 RepID=A0A7W2D697_9ACTN|nr:helix-turn-helix transcriptional regulator [Streptomyces himalayensis]MBA4865550.1 helix-turn-helix transcriptional regulator [Streptomyces himalayensis subsp. aureolus]
MAPRSIPTARRLRLGTELRRLRERAGLSATEGARQLGISQAQLSNIEASRFGVSPDRLRAMARIYRCSDNAYVDGLIELATERKGGWWETFREVLPTTLLDIAELEHHATRLWSANTAHIPGLLQTTDHAREVFRQVVPEFSRTDIEHRVSHRLQRQALLDRGSELPYRAVIHEAALRVPVGGPSVAKRQLEHLLEQSERDHITIQVIPFAIGAYPGSGQTILYVYGPVPQLDTVSLDQSHGPALVDAEAQLQTYRLLLDRMESVALKPEPSRDFIHNLTREL